MYLVDFAKRMARKSNIPVLIYLVLNVFFIAFVLQLLFSSSHTFPFWKALLIGMGVYTVSIAIALSPLGEWILRLQTGCKKIQDPAIMERIMPIFNEVYEKARHLDPTISPDVQLYYSDDEDANAFATGRKTVCITEGMLRRPADQIKATLGHEFGHLAHKDTDLILVVTVGNMIVSALILFIRIMIEFFHILFAIVSLFIGGSEGVFAAAINALYHLLITAVVSGLMWVWSKIGTMLVMKSSRSNEFEADEFSYRLGYGQDLCVLLDTVCGSNAKGLFANLASSHPDKADRIARILALEAPAGVDDGYLF